MPFNSTIVGQAYTRIQRAVIDYTPPATAHITVLHQHELALTAWG